MQSADIVHNITPESGIIFSECEFYILSPGGGSDVFIGGRNGEFAHRRIKDAQGTLCLTLDIFGAFDRFVRKSDTAQFQFNTGGNIQAEVSRLFVNSHLCADGEVEFCISGIDRFEVFADIFIKICQLPAAALVTAVNDDVFVIFQGVGSHGNADLAALHFSVDEDHILFCFLPSDSTGELFTGKVFQSQIGS